MLYLEHLIKNHEEEIALLSENYESFKDEFNKFEKFDKLINKKKQIIILNLILMRLIKKIKNFKFYFVFSFCISFIIFLIRNNLY